MLRQNIYDQEANTGEYAGEAEGGSEVISTAVDVVPLVAVAVAIPVFANAVDRGSAAEYQTEMSRYNHAPAFYYWLQRNAKAPCPLDTDTGPFATA